ncbi:hypothetical protein Tco_0549118, partial [Tanacetum coccineum]
VVPPPYTGNFMPSKPDLIYPSLDDFVDVNESSSESVVEKPTVETNEPKIARKEYGAPIIEDYLSESEEEDVPTIKTIEMFNKPSFAKINFVKSTKQVKSPRNKSVDKNRQNTPTPKGNKRNWNQHMSQKLGNDFEMFNKACHVCGSFEHLRKDCNNWYNNQSAARPVNTIQQRTAVNNAGPMKNVNNSAYSTARRPFSKITTTNNSNFNKRVNTVNDKNINAARPNAVVNTARPKAVLSALKGNKGNFGNPQQDLKDKGVIDSGCSRHMTGNKSYLTDYEEIDGGFVTFGNNSKGGKITRKCKIRTGKLDLKDVYFVKELKFNLFSVSQMCDKKNSVLFTDTTCVVLSQDFKLTDETHVLLKVPRMDNMYIVDLKNVIPQGGLTCLFAKATPDESNLWHRRLGHNSKDSPDARFKPSRDDEKKDAEDPRNKDSRVPSIEELRVNQEKDASVNNTNTINTVSLTVNTAGIKDNAVDENIVYGCDDDPNMPELEEIFYSDDDEDVGAEADINNLDTYIPVSPIPTT